MSDEIQIKIAERFYMGGLVCAETVFSVLWELGYCGDVPKEAFRLMTPFGGGIAGKKSLCGAVEGAVAAIGAHYGRTGIDPEAKTRSNEAAGAFIDLFTREKGSVLCGELIKKAEEEGICLGTQGIYDFCRPYIVCAIGLAMRVMDSEKQA